MDKVTSFFKFIFYISILFLIIISLYPGSLLGELIYGDSSLQPNLAFNPIFTPLPRHLYTIGSIINHFIIYFFITIFGLSIYLRNRNFQKIAYGLFFLSIFLEILQFLAPRRAFEIYDLSANFIGVLFAYCIIRIYKSRKKL
tara:strand:- start:177 stop:602 length:426 start_codon:yes stop_codon:yes gene_type:complete